MSRGWWVLEVVWAAVARPPAPSKLRIQFHRALSTHSRPSHPCKQSTRASRRAPPRPSSFSHTGARSLVVRSSWELGWRNRASRENASR
ncbi:hypothetical protein AAT19DRAFT_16247 [Rhodotorula toruloides]|uniref:Uncharacterized protein n=1 Tax=Rhodotorula toruloides TaxID=5286 RepID=A0A2T0A649_RHOTO|nr:hypothetical protein AAT19DRAFT_16247 [Rhodotorula toruloides]